jgi:methionyl-tRNA formyltransferase
MKKIKVAILLDKSNNWIESEAKYFVKNFKKKRFKFKFFYEYKHIKKYSIVFLLGFTKIIKPELLKHNSINLTVHESNLPKNKGFAPIQYQILNNQNIIKACLIDLSDKVDSGEIYEKNTIRFNGTELYDEIRKKQSSNTFYLISSFLNKYPKNKKKKQKGKSNFLKKRHPYDSELNINKSIKDNFNLLRISNNETWPAFFMYKGQKFVLNIFKK